jgi:hypothetical protein
MYFYVLKKYKGPKVLVKECQVLKDSMSFIAVLYSSPL